MAFTFFLSFFEYSNGLTIFAVLILFLITLLFVSRNMIFLRIHGAEELMFPTGRSMIDSARKPIPKIDMMKVHILFSFKLLNLPSSENQNELQCLISSKVDYCIQVIWGVNIRELHINLWHHWKTLKKSFVDNSLLQNSYQFKTIHETRAAHDDQVVTLKIPDSQIELGLPPRLCYPLVVLLVRNDEEECIHPDETVALVNVVHIRDSICTLPTSILSQYLKQANGQLSCLKQLYLATGNLINYEKEENNSLSLSLAEPLDQVTGDFQKAFVCQSEDNKAQIPRKCANIDQLCVVCQSYPLSRALLPCRHTCLCAICFEQLDRCPLCRGSIRSFFCIRNEDYVPKKAEHDSSSRGSMKSSRSLMYWLEHWNEILNEFLGFPR